MKTWAGVVYVAFVVDTFSRRIVGWSAATVKETVFVLDALEMALWQRNRDQHPIRPGELIQPAGTCTAEQPPPRPASHPPRRGAARIPPGCRRRLAALTLPPATVRAAGKRPARTLRVPINHPVRSGA
ncbi:DDE-type integrase/transposase/recombinase [Streptomyces sp. NPDC056817]|uniref:DDE-type integrase/transposase/recombinase n=1 Tax=Streptomyces sp. NPDC056817 TaxID=3345950 RepID=UPI0036AD4A5E